MPAAMPPPTQVSCSGATGCSADSASSSRADVDRAAPGIAHGDEPVRAGGPRDGVRQAPRRKGRKGTPGQPGQQRSHHRHDPRQGRQRVARQADQQAPVGQPGQHLRVAGLDLHPVDQHLRGTSVTVTMQGASR